MFNSSAKIVEIFFSSSLEEKSKEWQFLDKVKVLLSAHKEENCEMNEKQGE